MKINILSLLTYLTVLLFPGQAATAQECAPASGLVAQRASQSIALSWSELAGADSVLCYRWTQLQHGWRYDWQQVLPGDGNSLIDNTVGPAKTYQYGILVHYPNCGWTLWQFVVVGPYSSVSTSGSPSSK